MRIITLFCTPSCPSFHYYHRIDRRICSFLLHLILQHYVTATTTKIGWQPGRYSHLLTVVGACRLIIIIFTFFSAMHQRVMIECEWYEYKKTALTVTVHNSSSFTSLVVRSLSKSALRNCIDTFLPTTKLHISLGG